VASNIRRHPLAAFFVLAYLFSWSYWVPLVLFDPSRSHFPGLLGPMLASITVTASTLGKAGLRDLTARILRWRTSFRWYGAALVPAVSAGAGIAAMAVADRGWPSLSDLSSVPGLPSASFLVVTGIVFFINGFGEEVGWRGFAWDHLRRRYRLAGAAGILGLVWAGWHLPTFWLDTGMSLDWFVIPGWIVGLVAGAVVLGWLYERSGRSLLIVALFHTVLNVATSSVATAGLPAAFTSAVVVVWAVWILRREASA
jgi:membrane protease YdiL (CAAX protease family)